MRTVPTLALVKLICAIFLFLAQTVHAPPAGALLAVSYPTPGQIVNNLNKITDNSASVLSVVSPYRQIPAVTAARRPVRPPGPAGEEGSATDLAVTGGEGAGAGNDINYQLKRIGNKTKNIFFGLIVNLDLLCSLFYIVAL